MNVIIALNHIILYIALSEANCGLISNQKKNSVIAEPVGYHDNIPAIFGLTRSANIDNHITTPIATNSFIKNIGSSIFYLFKLKKYILAFNFIIPSV